MELFRKRLYQGLSKVNKGILLEILEAMVQNPKLIERPIIKSKKGVVIGRSLERVQEVI